LNTKELVIELTDNPSDDDHNVLVQGLRALNEPYFGPADFRALGVFARLDGKIQGGMTGATSRGMLHVDFLWVHPERRSDGLGSRLLALAEEEAKARGCRGSWLNTFDFQARPFYERNGYTVFGELHGFTNGHFRIFMSKMF
jgi:GNAT superfamily N-acetyltransferase